VFLAQYVQVACEERSGNTRPPGPDCFIAVLEALLAVRSLRTGRGGGLDRFYLGNLDVPVATVFNERQFDPELLRGAIADLIQGLRQGETSLKHVAFAGRNFYVALRDESVNDVVALNRSLTTYLGVLFRLAARGHWIRERRPLRMPREVPAAAQVIETSESGPFQVTACIQDSGDLTLLIDMRHRGVRYPLGSYPEIREFEAMLRQLDRGQVWNGGYFSATAEATGTEGQPQFVFCRRADGVLFTFSDTEWRGLDELVQETLARPELRALLDRLSLEYGDV
jgi:hypothetical protein